MQTDHLLPRPETPSLKRLLWVPVVVLAILVGASVFWYKSMPTGGASFDPIFHQTKDGWRQMPMPAGSLGDNIRVSGRGTVWLDTWAGVSRWDGAAWRLYNETISHDGAGPTHGGFALDGEEVWTLKKKGVLHWDGQLWKFYREPYTADGASMVAGDGQAWILDLKGNFSHFQDGRWESHALELPGVSWTGKDAGWPALARTADGVVWLVCRGIWRLDGARWSRMTEGADGLGHAVLVGAVADRLWFSDSKGLRSVSKDGGDWIVSPAQRTGLAARVWFYDVASAAGRTWFATSSGLVEFDGTVWRPVALPGVEVPGISRVTAGPDGDLWIIGSPPAWRAWRTLLGLALLPLAILVVIFWISRRLAHRRLQQHRRVTEAVQHATGEIPQELEHGERRLVRSLSWREYIIITAVLYIGGFTVLQRLWPKGTLWPIPVILVGIHLAEIFRDSLMKRKLKASDPIGPGGPSHYDWGKTWKAAAGGLLLMVLFNLDRLPWKFLRGNTFLFFILVLVPVGYKALEMFLLNGATRRADYDAALKTIRWFHFYNPTALEPLAISGSMLLIAGRYREAEETLRRAMVSSHAEEHYGIALEHLGAALMEQGRYAEATRSCEAAIHAFSWMRRPYRGMAEILLRQGKNPKQALEYVEKIIDFAGLSSGERRRNGRPQDDYWGLKAWALALLGRSSEVAPAIENALRATDKTCLPDLATTHYYAGMAMQTLGLQSSANEHFNRAMEFDPKGRRGVLAKSALRECLGACGLRS